MSMGEHYEGKDVSQKDLLFLEVRSCNEKRIFRFRQNSQYANKFLKESEIKDEFFFDLKVVFDEGKQKLGFFKRICKSRTMFNENYAYNTSMSTPMVNHFRNGSVLKGRFNPKSVLEIGSNDGPVISNFPTDTSFCVEPCDNFAKITAAIWDTELRTDFWTLLVSKEIEEGIGKVRFN